MNRSTDSRSDLYSYGVTLYEMLTCLLPFSASDAMEWVHCHVARRPTPPDERTSGIPPIVSSIVMKLLTKTAEERYQTTACVESDPSADVSESGKSWDASIPFRSERTMFRIGSGFLRGCTVVTTRSRCCSTLSNRSSPSKFPDWRWFPVFPALAVVGCQ